MTSLMVGCPVYHREWILAQWFAHVEEACLPLGITPTYAFVVEPEGDYGTLACVQAHADMLNREAFIAEVETGFPDRDPLTREWHRKDRLDWMVLLRNKLLEFPREHQPDYFLSLDSDILIHPEALVKGLEAIEDFDALGMKTFLGAGTRGPLNYGYWRNERHLRGPLDYLATVDIIAAAKLMKPAAYAVDYEYNSNGEDVGWSLACQKAGLTLGFDARITSKHVMRPDKLYTYDERCGY